MKRKEIKTEGSAHSREDERQMSIEKYVSRDPPLPAQQFDLCLYLLTVCVLMCHLPFSFVNNYYFRQFLRGLRPAFEKLLGGRHIKDKMAGPLLDEVHEEALQIAEEALTSQPGLTTLGIDGHKDGRGRSLQTITKAKLGVSTFAGCEYMLTDRATGERLARIVKSYILHKPYQYGAVVADNTGNNTAMFNELAKVGTLSHIFFLGCVVHVLDLLVEDVATLTPFATLAKDAHFVISFVKSHSIINEEFLEAKAKLGIKSDLHLYPSTRFAYLYLMLQSLHKTIAAVRVLIDSPIYKMAREEKRKRGGEEGRKATEKFNTFELTVEARSFKLKLDIGANVLMPLSLALHYLEGDSIPMSHIYPTFQAVYDYVQTLADEFSNHKLLTVEDCERMVELVKERWLGAGRKVGLKTNAHLLAFVLDPYAQAAVTTPSEPSTLLFNATTLDGARTALRHHLREADQRAMASQQMQLWLSSRPTLPAAAPPHDETQHMMEVVATGHTAFSSLYLAACQLVWDKALTREKAVEVGDIKRPIANEKDPGYNVAETIARLKLTNKPTTFWLSMMAEQPENASREALEAHKFFCRTAINVSSIVGHNCGVERAGKAYKLVMTAHRKAMHPPRASKAVYIMSNYGLLKRSVDLGDGLADFAGSLLVDAHVAEAMEAKRLHALRRGRIITDDDLCER